MRVTYRHFLPLAIAAAMVAGLGAAPVAAQSDDPVTTSAVGSNADQVDYKDAVGAKASRTERAKKLVATNREGRLPSNILEPLWRLMKGIPAVLADGKISWAELVAIPADLADGKIGWAEVTNKPAGFADGVDDGAFVSEVVKSYSKNWSGGEAIVLELEMSKNVDFQCSVLPLSGVTYWDETFHRAYVSGIPGNVFWYIVFQTPNGGAGEVKVRCNSYSVGITPAALKQAFNAADVTVKSGKKAMKGR